MIKIINFIDVVFLKAPLFTNNKWYFLVNYLVTNEPTPECLIKVKKCLPFLCLFYIRLGLVKDNRAKQG